MQHLDRRRFLRTAGAGAAALALAPLAARSADKQPGFTLPKLPYAYDALEPHIDAETMKIHHDFHHKAYVDNLNKALAGHEDLLSMPIDDLLKQLDKVPQNVRTAVTNNGGGHANHSMFWQIMGKANGKPSSELASAIDEAFGSFDEFKKKLSQAAITQFGSGWGWLVLDQGKLKVLSTANQGNPLSKNQAPIMGIDVWEHAYYLKYRNKRPAYVEAWWNVANWDNISERYNMAKKQA